MLVQAASLLALAASAVAAPAPSACSALWQTAPKLISNLTIYVAESYPDNTTFSTPTATTDYNTPVTNLSAFCRFGAYFNTSSNSRVQFEVWLPEDWNGRFAMVGNGGDAGGINYPSLGAAMSGYQFATSSTDTGHNGTSGDGTFAINNPESQIDFGWRAVHLTAVYSKLIINAYYGSEASNNYWIGCSSGGKQGLKELQMFPDTFDGVIAGAAAQWWPHLNAQTYRVNALVNGVNLTGHLTPADYGAINAVVLEQCDELDGLKDGIITNPDLCSPDLSSLSCSATAANASSCLNDDQIETMKTIWSDYSSTTGEWLFPGFKVGAEGFTTELVSGTPYGPGPDYFNYQVLNNTAVTPFNITNNVLFEGLIALADKTDPGQTNAINGYIEPFLSRGKLITFVGLADYLIPTGSSLWYHSHVEESLGRDVSDAYRLFTVPGMGHCAGGTAAQYFGNGRAGNKVASDPKQDMVLALIDWTENGNAPEYIVGSQAVNTTVGISSGIAFQRKLCPYPQEGVYIGGDANSADSFECQTPKVPVGW
ncbi:hypothetical protein MNV49_005128 [Pseudohyphozyma bogoriensis]|nr:hypothetical protein MNV49_005128 [Pseudohyphozyma bogoriensis]